MKQPGSSDVASLLLDMELLEPSYEPPCGFSCLPSLTLTSHLRDRTSGPFRLLHATDTNIVLVEILQESVILV